MRNEVLPDWRRHLVHVGLVGVRPERARKFVASAMCWRTSFVNLRWTRVEPSGFRPGGWIVCVRYVAMCVALAF